MADPAPPPGFTVDQQEPAPPAGFTVDAPTDTHADLPGFTDEQQKKILAYIPKATDAADLTRYSSELTQGRSHIGNAQAILDAYKQGHRQFSWEAPMPAQPEPAQDPSLRDKIGDGLLDALDRQFPGLGQFLRANEGSGKAFTEHVANSLVGDYGPEAGGLIDSIIKGGNLKNNIAHERAILEGDSEGHGAASFLGELSGAAATGALGNEAGLANLSRGGNVAAATGAGAVYGSGAGGPDNRVEGAITGAALGGATEAAAPIIVRAIRGTPSATNKAFTDAADRQGISYMAADLPNAPKSKFATALSSLTIGGIPLAEQGEKNVASAAAASGRVANDIGNVTDATGAGQAAQRGAKSFMESTEKRMGDLYDAIPIADTAPASVTNTRAALSDLTNSFQSNPKLAALLKNPQLSDYLDALTPQTKQVATGLLDEAGNPITRDEVHGGGLSWADLKDFRSRVGKIIGQPGLSSDGQQITELRSLYGALSRDMEATATAESPQTANAFARANTYARARSNRIENVVSMILGNNQDKAPQTAFEALQRLANDKGGDPIKLARALRSMPEEEANSVRATIFDDLGQASAGHQNDKGDVFSPATFVTNWNKISDRAKNVLFTGEHRKAIDDLALVFSGMKSSTKFANNSKTGLYVAGAHTLAVSLANPVLGALDAGLQYGGGKLLASPAFARKVAATPKTIMGAKAFWSRPWVDAMASKNPAIAGEIKAFQAAFLSHANDNSMVTAASANPDQQDQQQ
jgi:hypothetical protein